LLFGLFLEKEYTKIKDFAANSVPGKNVSKLPHGSGAEQFNV
jgi:hypothetical protein